MNGRSHWRQLVRKLRWVVVSGGLMLVFACNARTLEAPKIIPTSTSTNTYQETLNRKIDILFMIDDSSSMSPSQVNLAKNLPSFMNVIKGLPDGLPDLHIAVVTSDMGAGDGSITGCSGNGDNGVFQVKPTGTCTATNLQQGANYISAPIGANPNFTGDITSVFQCIAQTGDSGCGFEHQLASVARALGADGAGPPQENQGFIRPEAYLAIVFVTNEDDCSASMDFFDTDFTLGSPHGPPFRCNEFGHLCTVNGGAPAHPARLSPNPADLTTTVTYDNCVSAEGQGLLTPVANFVAGIKALKADPANQILVAAIIGPTTPYVVQWAAPPVTDAGPWPFIKHSCGSEADPAGFADPGIRMQQFVQSFGGNGLVYPFCSTNYAPALQTIAQKLSALIGPSCIQGTVANRPGTSTPDCTVTQLAPNPNDATKTLEVVLPACAENGNAAPCWSLDAPGAMVNCPAGSHVVNINRGGQMAADNTRNEVQCSMCIAGITDASRGCP